MSTTTLYNADGYTLESPDEDNEFQLNGEYVDAKAAVEIAKAILKNQGEDSGDSVVLASAVTFNEGLFRLAAAHNRTVTFRYAKGGGENIETRVLQPQNVQKVGDHLTFIGYDPDRDDVRAYRLDRVKGEVSVA